MFLFSVNSVVRVGEYPEADERENGHDDGHYIVAGKAFGQLVEQHEREDEVHYRNEEHDKPPQGFIQLFQQNVYVIEGNETFPKFATHFLESFSHEKQGQQSDKQG